MWQCCHWCFGIGNGAYAMMEEDVVAAVMQHWCGGDRTQYVRRNFQSSKIMWKFKGWFGKVLRSTLGFEKGKN